MLFLGFIPPGRRPHRAGGWKLRKEYPVNPACHADSCRAHGIAEGEAGSCNEGGSQRRRRVNPVQGHSGPADKAGLKS
jgi:hypothetical protein